MLTGPRTTATGETDEESESYRNAHACEGPLSHIVAEDVSQIGQLDFDLIELLLALFLRVRGEVVQLIFGFVGMHRSRATEIFRRVDGSLL